MKSFLFSYLSITLIALISTACSGKKDELSIKTKFTQINLIDAQGRSCTLKLRDPNFEMGFDLQPLKALIGGLELSWSGSKNIDVIYIRIVFDLGKQSTVITVSGEELAAILLGNPSAPKVLLQPGETIDSSAISNACNLEVGGIKVPNKDESISGQGRIVVYGVTDLDESPRPVIAENSFSVEYLGLE